MIKILVTGSAGYIGSHVVLALIEKGYQVIGLDNLVNSHTPLAIKGFAFYQGDIADTRLLDTIYSHHPDIAACIHLAGRIYIDESFIMPDVYVEDNVTKHRIFLETIAQKGTDKIVYSSSASVYGDANADLIDEDAPLMPTHPYGQTKLQAEIDIKDMARTHDMSSMILRYFNVAGADADMRTGQNNKRSTHLIKVACEVMTGQRRTLTINGHDYETPDGTCIRDYIHVSDLADIHVQALAHISSGGQSDVLNCGYAKGYSVQDICTAAQSISQSLFGKSITIQHGPRRKGDAPSLIANTHKLSERLQWTPRYDDLSLILNSALAWEMKRLENHP